MNKKHAPWQIVWELLILIGFSFSVQARIVSVQGTNSPSQLSLTSNSLSQVSWMVAEEPNAIGRAQISSSEGLYFDPSQKVLLGRSSKFLTQTRNLVGEMNTTFIFRESLSIPQNVLRSAQDMGLNQIIYVRSFQDNPGATSLANFVTFSLTASGSVGSVSVRQIQIEFDDGRNSAILSTGSKLQGKAIVSYQGTGLFQYTWELASPSTTNAQPIFVPMTTKQVYLMSSGETTLNSPSLPTNVAGTYLLRLMVAQPKVSFEMPILRYFVRSDEASNTNKVTQKISVSLPAENAILSQQTEFVWRSIAGAKAYQVEIFLQPIRKSLVRSKLNEKPVTGVIVPASQNRLRLGQISTTYLTKGSTYFWRVIAISEQGQKIGESEFRSINY